jgi:protein gp37
MGGKTSIEWTRGDDGAEGSTWNPVAGCSVVSPGCHNCYARNIAARFSKPGQAYHGLAVMTEHGPQWTGEMRLVDKHLADPLRWKKPRRVFVNSTSDLFHEGLTDEQIAAVFGVMSAAPRHTFQILTKRAKRAREWNEWIMKRPSGLLGMKYAPKLVCAGFAQDMTAMRWTVPEAMTWPLPNVWLGVSVEDQKRADERIPDLLDTPSAVRFVSYEPALGPVDFTRIRPSPMPINALTGRWSTPLADGSTQEPRLHWVICGAESGHGARPFDENWARSTRDACIRAGVAFFYKQNALNGRKIPLPMLDGRQWMEFPQPRLA